MPQQQPQQQQMAATSLELVGWSTRLAASALARISITSARSMEDVLPIFIAEIVAPKETENLVPVAILSGELLDLAVVEPDAVA